PSVEVVEDDDSWTPWKTDSYARSLQMIRLEEFIAGKYFENDKKEGLQVGRVELVMKDILKVDFLSGFSLLVFPDSFEDQVWSFEPGLNGLRLNVYGDGFIGRD